jgi:hypothetical protein
MEVRNVTRLRITAVLLIVVLLPVLLAAVDVCGLSDGGGF